MADRPGALASGLLALWSGDADSTDAQAAAHVLAAVLIYLRRALTRA